MHSGFSSTRARQGWPCHPQCYCFRQATSRICKHGFDAQPVDFTWGTFHNSATAKPVKARELHWSPSPSTVAHTNPHSHPLKHLFNRIMTETEKLSPTIVSFSLKTRIQLEIPFGIRMRTRKIKKINCECQWIMGATGWMRFPSRWVFLSFFSFVLHLFFLEDLIIHPKRVDAAMRAWHRAPH